MKTQIGLPVLFRRFPAGDVIALLPTVPGDTHIASCLAYQNGELKAVHLDQTVHDTVTATPEEYQELLPALKKEFPQNDLLLYERHQSYWFTQMRLSHLEWVVEAMGGKPVDMDWIMKHLFADAKAVV
jgi:hypothetical protein